MGRVCKKVRDRVRVCCFAPVVVHPYLHTTRIDIIQYQQHGRLYQVVSREHPLHFLPALTPLRDAEGVEVIQPGEAEKIKEVSDQFNRFQMMNFNEHHHCLRGTHLKTQGVCPPGSSTHVPN